MQRVGLTIRIGAGLITGRSAMPLIKSPPSNFGSGNTKLRAIVTTAAAALIGTLVGGVSVLGIVMAVTQPPNHEIRSDMRAGGETAALTAPPSEQAATTPPQQQTAPAAPAQSVPAIQGPRTVWPDGLSARTNHDSETATETPVPQQASPPANDRGALHQNDESGAGREPSAANSGAVTLRDAPPNQMSPNTAPAKKRAVAPPPGQSVDRTVEAPAGDASIGNARGDVRKSQSQLARQPRRSPDTANQSGDDQAAAPPPQRRVIIQPSPDQAANDDRGHWGGGLFDFFGQNHSDSDHWNQDHWNNDWHGSYDSHD
jgi:hypothetical protein